jgi:hypothetical protein
MKIKIIILSTLFALDTLTVISQNKVDFGIKAGLQISNPRLYEFAQNYPYYRNRDDGTFTQFYGSTLDVLGYNIGAFAVYPLTKSNKIKIVGEVYWDIKGYKQLALQNAQEFTVYKNYLEFPLILQAEPFKNCGLFLETGIYQSLLLSNQTEFPATNNNSTEFEKRRSLALNREINLAGFIIGAGYKFKKLSINVDYKIDQQYDYVQTGIRYNLKK